MQIDMPIDRDMSSDGRWLNYDQIAELRRIDRLSAIKLATRNGWQRRKGNTGQMHVLVPLAWLERSRGRRDKYRDIDRDSDRDIDSDKAGGGDNAAAFTAALDAIREAHAGEVAALLARAEAAEIGRDAADRRAETERRRADQAEAKAEAVGRLGEALRDRAALDAAGAKLQIAAAESKTAATEADRDQLLASHNRALLEVEGLRTADRERRSANRLKRLKTAWRGE